MKVKIENVDVQREGEEITAVEVRFGDRHELNLFRRNGQVFCRLASQHVAAVLDASVPGCDFERAINLLRLHLRHIVRDDST